MTRHVPGTADAQKSAQSDYAADADLIERAKKETYDWRHGRYLPIVDEIEGRLAALAQENQRLIKDGERETEVHEELRHELILKLKTAEARVLELEAALAEEKRMTGALSDDAEALEDERDAIEAKTIRKCLELVAGYGRAAELIRGLLPTGERRA